MTKTRFALVAACAALALPLAGCGTLLGAVGVSPATQTTVHLDTGKALDLAYGALDFVAVGLIEPAVASGAVHGQNAANIAQALRQARSLLDTAYNAYHAGIASNPTEAISSVWGLIGQIKAVLNGAGVATPSGPAPAAYHGDPGAVHQDLARVLTKLRSV